MCTILFSYGELSRYPLVIAANRDEFYERPTRGLHWWEDHPEVLGGRDLREGGTWFGITRNGRFATLTNFREPGRERADAPSRGKLVRDYLTGSERPEAFALRLGEEGSRYNGFNLLFGAGSELFYYANRSADGRPIPAHSAAQRVGPGLHGLSNHLLDTPWPKVRNGLERFEAWLGAAREGNGLFEGREVQPDSARALDWLADERIFPDAELPDTGVGLERERMLSALCIKSPVYGTRTSWVLTLAADGRVEVTEKSRVPEAPITRFSFEVEREGRS